MKRREVARLPIVLSCLLFLPAVVLAASTEAVVSPRAALEALDAARTVPQIHAAEAQIMSLGPDSHKLLMDYVKDEAKDGQRRFAALKSVIQKRSDSEKAAEIIAALSKYPGYEFRARCVMEMGAMRHPSFEPVLLKIVADQGENDFVQVSAAMSLAYMGNSAGKERALQAIMNAEVGADFGMRTLEKLHAKDMILQLQKRINVSKNYTIRNRCREAVLRIALVGADEDQQMDLLDAALREDGFWDVRQWAGLRLAKIGTGKAGQILAAIASDRAIPGYDSAVRGLAYGIRLGNWTEEDIAVWHQK